MKNGFLQVVLSSIILSGLAGCSKLLEETPKAIAIETFYNTAG